MTKAAQPAKPVAAAVADAPSVKIEEGTAKPAAVNKIAKPKVVSTDVNGNKIEEL